ncbi:MAG: peroxiredoxin family protein [Robiginitomaculum sp.]|nr:peroxiredoxin family protein [Robiginitomaculum sp.]
MRAILISIMFLVVSSAGFADDGAMAATDRGPEIGAMIPSDLTSIDLSGEVTNFDGVVGENGLVLAFVRSVKWCPFCKTQVKDLVSGVADINARGYSLVVLSYDSPKHTKAFAEEYELDFTLLSDRKSEVIDDFGIRNDKYGKFHFANGVPHPMIFIIGADKTIQAKLAEKGYKDRPPVPLIAQTIDSIIAAKEQ